MDSDDRARLTHMLESAQEARSFAEGKTRADLELNRMLAHALMGCLRIVGEAARQVSPESRQEYPDIPWRDIVGMRNLLVHEYFKIDEDVVWQTVTVDLPKLIDALEQEEL